MGWQSREGLLYLSPLAMSLGRHEFLTVRCRCNQTRDKRFISYLPWPTLTLSLAGVGGGGDEPQNPSLRLLECRSFNIYVGITKVSDFF